MNPANQAQNPQQQPRPAGGFGMGRMILLYFGFNWIMNQFFSKAPLPTAGIHNVFKEDEPLEFKMFLSNTPSLLENTEPIWEENNLFYNYNSDNLRKKNLTFEIDELLAQGPNPHLYAHIFIASTRSPESLNYSDYDQFLYIVDKIDLVIERPKVEKAVEENLLFQDDNLPKKKPNVTAKDKSQEKKYPHLRKVVWIGLVHDTNVYMPGQIPPQIKLNINRTKNGYMIYQPPINYGEYWLRNRDFALIDAEAENKTVEVVFEFNTYWIYKHIIEGQMSASNEIYAEWGIASDGMEDFKEMVLDSNPYLFGLTMLVSALHSLFEFLAVKNDIAFWKNLENHRGLSLRVLWYNFFQDIIILLYLLDNDTSLLILASSGVELVLTVWKLYKTTKFDWIEDGKFPFIKFEYRDQKYKSTTEEYDQVANKYLNWALAPLLIGYAIYSLIYLKHKGWYSFILETLVGFIYLFGFIQMTPQLYINYKLKSVEHMPWRNMIYKFLNTIIDDLFSFLITMPWLKRLSVFRDDIIFVIYIYQRWIYKVDKNRDPYGQLKKDKPESEAQEKPAVENNKPQEEKDNKKKAEKAHEKKKEAEITQRKVEEEKQAEEEAKKVQEETISGKKEPKMKKKKLD